MRILVTGSQCIGKSTFIKDFMKQWPMYVSPKRSYRQEAKTGGIKLNRDGDIEGQKKIQKILLDQLEEYKDKPYVIFDRGPLDNLVYSIWLNIKKIGEVDDLFIEQSIAKFKKTVSTYDIIFFIPILKDYPVEIVSDDQRDINPEFRKEVDNIFKGIIQTWHKGKDTFFPKDDCPAIIDIFGTPEQRIEMAKLYVNPKGDMYTDEDSLISDVDMDSELAEELKNQIKEMSVEANTKKLPQIML